MCNTPSHYALTFCEVSSDLPQFFFSYHWYIICNGQTDGQCDFNMLPKVPSGA